MTPSKLYCHESTHLAAHRERTVAEWLNDSPWRSQMDCVRLVQDPWRYFCDAIDGCIIDDVAKVDHQFVHVERVVEHVGSLRLDTRAINFTGDDRIKAACGYDASTMNVAVHMRRGDLERSTFAVDSRRLLPNEHFIRQMRAIGVHANFVIFSDAFNATTAFKMFPKIRQDPTSDPWRTIQCLASADVLIASTSYFSFAAALLQPPTARLVAPPVRTDAGAYENTWKFYCQTTGYHRPCETRPPVPVVLLVGLEGTGKKRSVPPTCQTTYLPNYLSNERSVPTCQTIYLPN